MPEPTLTLADVDGAFPCAIHRIRTTPDNRLRLAGVLLALAFLQALYLALIAGVLYLTWIYSIAILGSGIRLNLLTIVIYAGPPAEGARTRAPGPAG